MIEEGLEHLDGPSVILSSEEHGIFTTRLRDATKGIRPDELTKLWDAYKDVYKLKPHWRKAIEQYFLD
ncbi:MAG TPA: hypothetical protein VM694_43660 [Polyangium sp.]|nr:hypothetical protein [Polyangium sp.]